MATPTWRPVDLQAQTRFVKERVESAIAELEEIARLTDPIFVSPRDVALNLWLAETRNRQCIHRDEVSLVAVKFSRRP
jgi:hypothetical protein